MKRQILTITALVLIVCGLAYGQNQKEMDKIQYLIGSIENIKGVKFIRNGSEHTGKEAASHLRLKLENAGNRIKTAEDFIKICASRSSITGKPYIIKFDNRNTLKAEDYFNDLLKRYESK